MYYYFEYYASCTKHCFWFATDLNVLMSDEALKLMDIINLSSFIISARPRFYCQDDVFFFLSCMNLVTHPGT